MTCMHIRGRRAAVLARLNKYLQNDFRHLSAGCYPGSETLVICLIQLENDAEDD